MWVVRKEDAANYERKFGMLMLNHMLLNNK
jgi:hypothetical protein